MTQYMVACQRALLDLIDACVKELKRGNPAVCSLVVAKSSVSILSILITTDMSYESISFENTSYCVSVCLNIIISLSDVFQAD